MSRTQKKWSILTGLLAAMFAGCSPASLGWLLKDDKTPPEFALTAREGRKEVAVLVVTGQPPALSADPSFASAARDMGSALSSELVSESAGTKHPITIIDPQKLERHKQTLPDWRMVGSAALGRSIGADYVIDATITRISMFQREDAGELYNGQAEVNVLVYDTSRPDSSPTQYTHTCQMPQKSIAAMSQAAYRTQFLKRLGAEIAWRHVAHDRSTERPMR